MTARIEQQVVGAVLIYMKGAGGLAGFSLERLASMPLPPTRPIASSRRGSTASAPTCVARAGISRRCWRSIRACGGASVARSRLRVHRPVRQGGGCPRAGPPDDGAAGQAGAGLLAAHLGGRLMDAYSAARRVQETYPFHCQRRPSRRGRPGISGGHRKPWTPCSRHARFRARTRRRGSAGWTRSRRPITCSAATTTSERSAARALDMVAGASLAYLAQARAARGPGPDGGVEQGVGGVLTVPPSARPTPGVLLVTAATELRAHGHADDSRRVAQQALRWVEGLDATLAGAVPTSCSAGPR